MILGTQSQNKVRFWRTTFLLSNILSWLNYTIFLQVDSGLAKPIYTLPNSCLACFSLTYYFHKGKSEIRYVIDTQFCFVISFCEYLLPLFYLFHRFMLLTRFPFRLCSSRVQQPQQPPRVCFQHPFRCSLHIFTQHVIDFIYYSSKVISTSDALLARGNSSHHQMRHGILQIAGLSWSICV